MKQPTVRAEQQGFTIIELLIATAVFSTILVLASGMMINIGRLYYKGINQSRIQYTVRTITDELAAQLQLADNVTPAVPLPGGVEAICIATTRYTYIENHQLRNGPLDADHSPHVLWRDNNPTPNSCVPVTGFPTSPTAGLNGVELMAPNSTLTEFMVAGTSPYTVTIAAAYGDTGPTGVINLAGVNSRCRPGAGSQFCSTAHLTTAVARRITVE
jgi:prepilin-type N-terminal cleavage/methylation domain-containing protein